MNVDEFDGVLFVGGQGPRRTPALAARFASEYNASFPQLADLPMLSIYIAWPLAGAVWALFLAEKMIRDVRIMRGDEPEWPDTPDPPDPVADQLELR